MLKRFKPNLCWFEDVKSDWKKRANTPATDLTTSRQLISSFQWAGLRAIRTASKWASLFVRALSLSAKAGDLSQSLQTPYGIYGFMVMEHDLSRNSQLFMGKSGRIIQLNCRPRVKWLELSVGSPSLRPPRIICVAVQRDSSSSSLPWNVGPRTVDWIPTGETNSPREIEKITHNP